MVSIDHAKSYKLQDWQLSSHFTLNMY